MPVTNYYSVNGEIIAEKTTGSPRIDYMTDALGSVTATVNQNAQVVNTYRYKPYGSLLAKTGTGSDPSFQWVGTQGYRQTGRIYSDVYVRARHYDTTTGRWTTKGSLWPTLPAYEYAGSRPTSIIDLSGIQPDIPSGWKFINDPNVHVTGNGPGTPGSCNTSSAIFANYPRWTYTINVPWNGSFLQHVKITWTSYFCDGNPNPTGLPKSGSSWYEGRTNSQPFYSGDGWKDNRLLGGGFTGTYGHYKATYSTALEKGYSVVKGTHGWGTTPQDEYDWSLHMLITKQQPVPFSPFCNGYLKVDWNCCNSYKGGMTSGTFKGVANTSCS